MPKDATEPTAAQGLRLPAWIRWEFRFMFVFSATMAVWSPWGEPGWWRLLFVAWVALSAYVFGVEKR